MIRLTVTNEGNPMKLFNSLLAVCLCLSITTGVAFAGPGMVKITNPKDNALFDADEAYPLDYEIELGKGGDHFHVWVDDKKGPAQRTLKGTYTLPKLSPGKHEISIKVVDKDHVPTGPEKTLNITAK